MFKSAKNLQLYTAKLYPNNQPPIFLKNLLAYSLKEAYKLIKNQYGITKKDDLCVSKLETSSICEK